MVAGVRRERAHVGGVDRHGRVDGGVVDHGHDGQGEVDPHRVDVGEAQEAEQGEHAAAGAPQRGWRAGRDIGAWGGTAFGGWGFLGNM